MPIEQIELLVTFFIAYTAYFILDCFKCVGLLLCCYSRCLVADGADPIGPAGSGARRFWHVVLPAGLADSLSAGLAKGPSIDDAAQSGPAPGAAPAVAAAAAAMFCSSRYCNNLLLASRVSARLQGAFLS